MSTFRQKVQATTNWEKPVAEAASAAASGPAKAARDRAGRARKAAPAPVAAHPLFPVFAALWFAALFGLASLAIPGAALGALVVKTGLPALVPAAAPPLGFTAHLLVAFAMAGFGGAVGLALGLRLRPAGAQPVRPAETATPAPAPAPEADDVYKVRARDAHPDAPPRRPLVLTEALGEPLGEEPAPSDAPLLRRKPAPGAGEPAPVAPWIAEFTPGGSEAAEPRDLAALDLAEADEVPASAIPEPEMALAPFEEEPDEAASAEAEPAAGVAAASAPLVPEAPVLIAATPQLPAGFTATLPDAGHGTRSPVAGAPLENLGLVQLIERLALAIAARKAAAEAALAEAEAALVEANPVAAGGADNAPAESESMPGLFSRPQNAGLRDADATAASVPTAGSAREAILRRLGAVAVGEDMAQADGSAPFSRPVPAAAPATGEAVIPLRLAELGATPAAPQADVAPFENDAALRSALATLQRMTARG